MNTFAVYWGAGVSLSDMLQPLRTASSTGLPDIVQAWVERLGWVLVHSTWQLAAIAVIAALVEWRLKHHTASVRYITGVTALVAMLMLPCVTWILIGVPNRLAVHPRIGLAVPANSPTEMAETRIVTLKSARNRMTRPARIRVALELNANSPRARDDSLMPAVDAHEIDRPGFRGSTMSAVALNDLGDERLTTGWQEKLGRVRANVERELPLIVSLWFLGVALCASRPIWGLWTQWHYCRVGLSPVPERVQLTCSISSCEWLYPNSSASPNLPALAFRWLSGTSVR